jgi:hypothetical protein
MKTAWLYILFVLTLGLLASPVKSQYTGATARLDSTSLLIGNQSKLELTVTVPAGSILNWPILTDTLARNVEILRKSGLDTVSSNDRQFTLKQDLVITSFDSGYYVIPPIRFNYSKKGDTVTYFTETAPVYLSVNTIQTNQKNDIKPIKPPLKAPITFKEVLTWVALALLVAAIAFALYYFLLKKKKKEPLLKIRLKPTIPVDEAALEAFETLRLKKLWQSGRVKEYYSEMTDIVREYIELRFVIRALEMTTDEIASAIKQTNVNGQAREKLLKTLTLADLVKFAKEQPLPVENDLSLNHCIDFVRETWPPKNAEPEVPQATDINQQKPVN